MKIPCENCLLIAICRIKLYHDLIQECSNIFSFLIIDDKPLHRKRIKKVHKYLRISVWLMGEQHTDEDGGGYNILRGDEI